MCSRGNTCRREQFPMALYHFGGYMGHDRLHKSRDLRASAAAMARAGYFHSAVALELRASGTPWQSAAQLSEIVRERFGSGPVGRACEALGAVPAVSAPPSNTGVNESEGLHGGN